MLCRVVLVVEVVASAKAELITSVALALQVRDLRVERPQEEPGKHPVVVVQPSLELPVWKHRQVMVVQVSQHL